MPTEYEAAIVPEIKDAKLLIPTELSAEIAAASVEVARFDLGASSSLLPFTALLLRGESSASSRIEKLTASARKLVEAEYFGGTALGKNVQRSEGNAPVIVANAQAMSAAASSGWPPSVDVILEMHKVLMEGTVPDIAGSWREEQVWIGGDNLSPAGADFVPPIAEHVPKLVDDLLVFLQRKDIPALAKAAIAHAQFETIHPFVDGNGRTGRALVHLVLSGEGLCREAAVPLSAGLLQDVDTYFDALTTYRSGDPLPIIQLFVKCAAEGAQLGTWAATQLVGISETWQRLITSRVDTPDRKVAEMLLSQPVMDVATVMDISDVSRATARRCLERLEEFGIVTGYQLEKKLRVWRAPDVLDLLDDLAEGLGRRGAPGTRGKRRKATA